MHAKYEVSISYGSKVMAKFKVFLHFPRQTDLESQTGQKLNAPEFHSRGIKSIQKIMLKNHYLTDVPLQEKLRCVCETLCPSDNKVQKFIFSFKVSKSRSQGH